MNINAISLNKSNNFAGRKETTSAMRTENRQFSNSFRRMFKSPVYDGGLFDTDEVEFRSGLEDYESGTMIRTSENNIDNWAKERLEVPESPKTKPAKIATAEQAGNVKRLISELDLLKMTNPQESSSIGAQIARLKSLLRKYYSEIGKSVKI